MVRLRRFFLLTTPLVFAASVLTAQVSSSVYDQAAADLDQHKYLEAEAALRAALEQHPQDATALGLMGVVLDAQKGYAEAEGFYQRAVRLSPDSPSLFNNLGNHYFAQGKPDLARDAYLQVVRIDAHDENTNLQLAQIDIARKQGRDALHYLGQLESKAQAVPGVQLLRARALRLTGDSSAAEAQLLVTLKQSPEDPQVAFSVGVLFAKRKNYEKAEGAFLEALRAAPTNFDVLYNLGLAALRARDLPRAEQVFQVAAKQRPDVDCLLGLARTEEARGDLPQAATNLYRAQRLAPDRPDVWRLLAGITQKIGLYDDSTAACDKLLKLQPGDQLARRDRGCVLARDRRFAEAVTDLSSYVHQYPRDPVGLNDLALAESLQQKDLAIQHLTEALALDPKMGPARLARAALLRQRGKFDDAVNDLNLILIGEPDKVPALDLLGDIYLATGRPREAREMLLKASQLAPENSLVLLHYGQALLRTGQAQSAQAELANFQRLRASEGRTGIATPSPHVPMPGAAEPQVSSKGRANLAAANPKDLRLKVQLGRLLLSEGKTAEALEVFRKVSRSTATDLRACGRALVEAEQFKAALEFVKAAVAANPEDVEARMDLALALFHEQGAESALIELEKIPADHRQGDYFLLRAQLLDSLGRIEEEAEALNQGFRASPTRAGLYFQAALFLIKNGQVRQAVEMLEKADKLVPANPVLWLTRAFALEIFRQDEQALALLTQLESLSPTWYLPYEIQGIILAIHFKPAQAKPALQLAIALAANDPKAYYYLAFAILRENAGDVSAAELTEAQSAIDKALALDPKDPYAQSLAGEIAFLKKDYAAALQHLDAALAIWPDMVEAHETLSANYRALGQKDKSAEELKAVLRIKQQTRTGEQAPPFPTTSLLFAVRAPEASGEPTLGSTTHPTPPAC